METTMRLTLLLTAALVGGFTASTQVAASHEAHAAAAAATAPSSAKVVATRDALRGLWKGHVVAVRKVVVAAIAKDAAAQTKAEAEAVSNAHAIAGTIELYYGAAARDQLFTLLAGHYGAVKAYLEASLAKDAKRESAATDQITVNAEAIATLLSGANPNWSKDALNELLLAHGGHHIGQIQQLIAKDAKSEADTWKAMTAHMDIIADALADGLAKQFPAKF
jgi:hypothetical protein